MRTFTRVRYSFNECVCVCRFQYVVYNASGNIREYLIVNEACRFFFLFLLEGII